MKVLHLPTAVGGHPWGLSRGERALGLRSEVLVSVPDPIQYPADIRIDLPARASKAGKFSRLAGQFLTLRKHYEIFHFNYGSSLIHFPQFHLNQFELPFYPRKAGLFVTYNGCDARQKYPTMRRAPIAACHNPDCYGGQCNSGLLDRYRKEGIAKMSRYVAHMWAVNPDLLHFLPRDKSSFLPYAIAADGLPRQPPRLDARTIKVVHAPTDRANKGTEYVIAAVNKVNGEHPGAIDFTLVEGRGHEEAVKLYRGADLVIDQLLVGWYGGLAVECMKMGKPVISRIAEKDLAFIPREMARELQEAIINADFNTLYHALRRCLEDRVFLGQRAQAGEAYAHRWHDPRHVAAQTKQRYEEALGSL
jgi:hypothetical protein